MNRVFYAVVVGISLAGATESAADWLHWWVWVALLAVGAVELGGVVLSVHALRRMELGERAIWARLLSAAVAGGAVAINFFGHQGGPAYFFGGMSALGYGVWLMDSGARRRDALRDQEKLAPTAPVYGMWSWMRHPLLTMRARALALRTPELGKFGSLTEAVEQARAEKRAAAIASALRTRIANHVDPTMATIAVNTYDLDKIAQRLADGADYDGLTSLLSTELLPTKLHTPPTKLDAAHEELAHAAQALNAEMTEQVKRLTVGNVGRPLPTELPTAHHAPTAEQMGAHGWAPDPDLPNAWVLNEQMGDAVAQAEQIVGNAEQQWALADLMPTPTEPTEQLTEQPVSTPLPTRLTDGQNVGTAVRLFEQGLSDTAIGGRPDMPSRSTVQRWRSVWNWLKTDINAEVPASLRVTPAVVERIRAEVKA